MGSRGLLFRRLLPAALIVACCGILLAGVASAGSTQKVRVTISASPTSLFAGDTTTITGRVAKLPAGTRLAIGAQRSGESRARVIGVCRRATCSARWRETTPRTVRFIAIVFDAKNNSKGSSRVVTLTWRARPVPPPAQAGHYEGRSSQNEIFKLDVSADGRTVVNVGTGQINTSCSDGSTTYGGSLALPGPYAIAADGSFRIQIQDIVPVSGYASARTIDITGRFSGALVSGTMVVTYNIGGVICRSGTVTWTIPRTA